MTGKRKFAEVSEESETHEESRQIFKLDVERELRFEVDDASKVTLELKNGLAEVFGTELVINRQYVFTAGAKIAVFTWHGCTLELVGKTEVVYVVKETPMVVYVNIHAALEQMRQKAEEQDTRGPTVLVTGSTDVGKSTLCRMLVNYAVRQGRSPIFVDLDVGLGQISVPGSFGALLVQDITDVEERFSKQVPLVYHFGHTTPAENVVLYNTLVSRIAQVIKDKSQKNRKAAVGGVIINTCGWVKGEGYKLITHAAAAFEADVVLVIDNEGLCNQLEKRLPQFVKLLKIPKSGGVVARPQSVRAAERDGRVREYFYGARKPLYPYTFQLKFSDIKVYKIGAQAYPASWLPLGMKDESHRTKLVPVPIGQNLRCQVLSVSFADSIEENIVQINVAGFICVTEVDTEKHMLTVLSPQPRPLRKSILLMGDVQFTDGP